MKEYIYIDPKDCTYVQKLSYEYYTSLHILEYIINTNNFPQEFIDKYLKISEQKGLELELAKTELLKKYPSNHSAYQYTIVFDDDLIEYDIKEEQKC